MIVSDQRLNVQEPPPMTVVERVRRMRDIHDADCRWKRQGVCCSTCSDLAERVTKLEARHGN